MKMLSDYKGKEAFELWIDLADPMLVILQDKDVVETAKKETMLKVLGVVMKNHGDEVQKIFERIDPEPVDGANLIGRLLVLLGEIVQDPVFGSFFGLAGLGAMQKELSGSATESIEDGAN